MRRYSLALIWACFLCFISTPCAQARSHEVWRDLGLYGGQILSVASDPHAAAIAYAGSWDGDGLFRSADGGRTWTSIPEDDPSWFGNLEVFDIATDPHTPGTLWVANSAFVDVSDDYGATWETFFFALEEARLCYAVAVDPHDRTGKTVYVGTGGPGGTGTNGALYKTGDGGRSWQVVIAAAVHDILDIAVDPLTPGALWAIASPWSQDSDACGQVLHSADGGSTWSARDLASTVQGAPQAFGFLDEIHVVADGSDTVFTCGQDGIAAFEPESADALEWSVRQSGDPCTAMCFEQPVPATSYAVFATTLFTSFDNWLTRAPAGAAPDHFLCMASISETPAAVLAGGRSRGVFHSTDGALTWDARNLGIKANTVYAAAVSPHQAGLTLCGTQAGTFVQHHCEGPWSLSKPNPTYAFAFHPEQPGTWYAGFDFALGKTLDHGAAWALLPVCNRSDARRVSALSVLAESPPAILAGLQDYAGQYGAIIRVRETGSDFSESVMETVFTADVPVNTLTHHPARPHEVFAGTGWFYAPGIPGGLYKSPDQGHSWQPCDLRNVVINSIVIAPSNPDLLYAACGDSGLDHAGIYKSADGGLTWQMLVRGLPARFSATDVWTTGDGSVVYAALYSAYTRDMLPLGGVYVTLDGGNYWTQIGLSEYLLYTLTCREESPEALRQGALSAAGAASATEARTVLAGSSSGLYCSSTAGAASLTGSVACAATGAMLDSAVVSASCGAHCITADGYYLMLLPPGTHTITAQAPGYAQSRGMSVSVLPSGLVTRNITLQPASAGDCPVSSIMRNGQHRHALEPLRLFRSRVLLQTPLGRRLAGLYYHHAADILRVLEQDPGVLRCLAGVITRALPCLRQLTDNEPCGISPGLADGVSAVLTALEQSAGPSLRSDVHALRTMLKKTMWASLFSEPHMVFFHHKRPQRPIAVPERP